jgi:hypothetical protein
VCALFLSLHVCLCVHRTFTISTLDGGNPASGAVHSPYKQAVGMRAAQGLLANASGTVAALPFMPPQYSSSSAGPGGVVTIKLADAGLYSAPPVLNSSVGCPPAIGAKNCESFAILGPDCVWHNATATIGSGGTLLLKSEPPLKECLGSRASYANWPVVTVTNKAGVPLLPWVEPVSPSAAAKCPHAWPPVPIHTRRAADSSSDVA